MDENKLDRLIEALLFAYGDPINEKKLISITGRKKSDILSSLSKLEQRLRSSSGLRLIRDNETVQIVTSKEYGPFIEKIVNARRKEELTRASLEVLAIIGYSGPVTREEIEQLRGVNSTYIVRSLIMRGLIEPSKKDQVEKLSLSLEAKKRLGLSREQDLPDWNEIQNEIEKAKHASQNFPHA